MAVAQIAEKYEMGVIEEQARDIIKLSAVIKEDPLRIFAFAFRFGWKDIGEIAARNFLAVHLAHFPLSIELRYIGLHEFHYLSDHRRRCSAAIKNWLVGDDDLHPKNLRSFQSLRRVLRDQWCTQSAHSLQCNSEWYQPGPLEFSPPTDSSGNTRISIGMAGWTWLRTYILGVLHRLDFCPSHLTILGNDFLFDKAIVAAAKCPGSSATSHRNLTSLRKRDFQGRFEGT